MITTDLGTIFWTTIGFGAVLFILGKYAWRPVLNILRERENNIESALKSAELARKAMAQLKAENEKILAEAKLERDEILKEARDVKVKLINEAKEQAAEEAQKMIETARLSFKAEKEIAMNEIKNQVAALAIKVAEKILNEKLSDYKDQKELMDNLMKDLKLN
jgi:F-type H+-transporting ATPase subunit b